MTSSKIEKGEMLNAEGKKEAECLPGRGETKGLIIPPLALAVEPCALCVCVVVYKPFFLTSNRYWAKA